MNNSNCKEKIDVIKSVNNMIKNQISNMKIKNKSKILKSNAEIVDDADFFPKLMNTLTRGDKGAKNLALEKTMFALSKNKYNIFKNLNDANIIKIMESANMDKMAYLFWINLYFVHNKRSICNSSLVLILHYFVFHYFCSKCISIKDIL